MWKADRKNKKLAWEIIEYLLLSAAIALFTFFFLYFTAESIAWVYVERQSIVMGEMQDSLLDLWLRCICGLAAAVICLALFLLLLGQRLSYLVTIIDGVEKLRGDGLDYKVAVEGEDELTELAESINYLAASQKEIRRKEQALKDEREVWIRSLSHDIRTPLTSMLSYTEFLRGKERLTRQEMEEYIGLVESKARQIRMLTEQLMGSAAGRGEPIENVKLLLEQLTMEWEELLEDRFCCRIDLEDCQDCPAVADIYALRRIFDNLASNVEKYADPDQEVWLKGENEGPRLTLIQKNKKKIDKDPVDSTGIGLQSIGQIASYWGGEVKVLEDEISFEIHITMNLKPRL